MKEEEGGGRGEEDKGVKQPHVCLPKEEVNEYILNGMIQNSGISMFMYKQYGGDTKKKVFWETGI